MIGLAGAAEFSRIYRLQLPLSAFLLYLHVALAVAGGAPSVLLVLNGLAFYALLQLAYLYDRGVRQPEDSFNLPESDAAVTVPPGRLILAAALVPAALLALTPEFRYYLLAAGLVLPVYRGRIGQSLRLKAIPLLKPLLNLAVFWSVSVLAPVLQRHEFSAGLAQVLLLSTWRAAWYIFALTVLLDIRDAEGDRRAGLWTLPAALGKGPVAMVFAAAGVMMAAASIAAGSVWHAAMDALFSCVFFFSRSVADRRYYEWVMVGVNCVLAAALVMKWQ